MCGYYLPTRLQALLDKADLLDKYRLILNAIHAQGNIYYDKGRMDAYIIIAKMASIERNGK